MKRKTVSKILLMLILTSMLTLAFNIRLAKAQGVIYIRLDGSIDPPTAAIQRNGDVYTFTDNIYDLIVVERNNTVIDGNGFTLQGTEAYESIGMDLSGRENVTVRNTQIKDWWYGIRLGSSLNNSISGNNITDNWYGIELSDSWGNSIFRNTITENNGDGIYLEGSSNNTIMENNIKNNGAGIGVNVIHFLDPSGPPYYLHIVWSLYNTISRNNITGNTFGVTCRSSNNTILENNIKNNSGSGIEISNYWGGSFYNTVSRNDITNNGWCGVDLGISAHYNNVSLNEISDNTAGVVISGDFAWGNIIRENNITQNVNGITGFHKSFDNIVYHNNFIDNDKQVHSQWSIMDGPQVWDDGYRSGGNYWSDYQGVDVFSGPNQNMTGSDGIGDAPYIISPYSEDRPYVDVDHYPLMNPWSTTPPTIIASVDMTPDTLSLRSKGKWITAHAQLPEGYNAADMNATTISLNGTIAPALDPRYGFVTNSSEYLVDHNNDGILERMVKFDRATVESFIYNEGIRWGNITLTITGKLLDGTPFEGTAAVFVRFGGDVNNDGKIDVLDAAAVSARWYAGPPTGPLGYDSNADLNNDGLINIVDSAIVSNNWGQTVP